MNDSKHIHPVFHRILGRKDKESFLNQRSKVIWMTGLSGSGKTTVAIAVEKALAAKGYLTQVLDGDNIRSGINGDLSFTAADRNENIRRIAEISKLFLNCGVLTINCFVSPTEESRQLAKSIIGKDDYVEIFIDTPLEECEKRDVKGLYKKARAGEIKHFTGIDAPFERPKQASLVVKTEAKTIERSAQEVLEHILPLIQHKN
jgi:adenylylsulfate kinase